MEEKIEQRSSKIAIFDGKDIRKVAIGGEWVYSIIDIIEALTESPNPRKYWSVLKTRLKQEGSQLATNCSQLKIQSKKDGKYYKTDIANTETILRLIQSIPSPKAEPFKLWLAKVGKERLDEIEQPSKAIERGKKYYIEKGYDSKWVESRTFGIETRHSFTDELKNKGLESIEYAIATNEIYVGLSNLTSGQYKEFKGISKEDSLRDNMTPLELASVNFAEAASTELLKKTKDKGLVVVKDKIKKASSAVRGAMDKIEEQTGEKIVTTNNNKRLDSPKKRLKIAQDIQENLIEENRIRIKILKIKS